MGQLIGSAAQNIIGRAAVLGLINHRLGMFHPKPDGKGFGSHRNSPLFQHIKGVSRTVAHSQNKTFAIYPGFIIDADCFKTALFRADIRKLIFKADFAAQSNNFFPHRPDNMAQHVGADMGFINIHNL